MSPSTVRCCLVQLPHGSLHWLHCFLMKPMPQQFWHLHSLCKALFRTQSDHRAALFLMMHMLLALIQFWKQRLGRILICRRP